MAAGENLCTPRVFLQEIDGIAERCRHQVLKVLRNHDALLALKIFQTFSDRIGMSICVTPNGESASTTAFTTAGVDPMVPASPTPLTPSGLTGDGVTVRSSSNSGKS